MKPNRSSSPSARPSSLAALAVVALGLLLTSCGGGGDDDDSSDNDPSVWHFRGINAVADAPQVQFYVDDTAVATADYGAATDYKPAHTGERPLKVAIRNASKLGTDDPGYTDIGTSESHDFQGPTNYTLVSAGTVASPRQFLITDTSRKNVEDNQIEYQVINAAAGAGSGALEVLILAPGAGIDSYQHVSDLAVGEYTDKSTLDVERASGDDEDDSRSTSVSFTIRQGGTAIYRSSSFSVAEQSRLLVVIADNKGPAGASPLRLMVFGGIAAGSASIQPNRTDPAEVRFANLSGDAGPVDLIIGSSAADVFASNVAYGAASPYVALETDTYNAIGTPTGNAGVFLFVNSLTAATGRSYTEYGQGPLSAMRGLLFTDDRRAVPSEARFRFLNAAASNAAAVDIYLTQRGSGLDLEADSPPTANVSALAYRGASSQLVLDGGSYDVYFTAAGDTDILAGPIPLDLEDGTVQTLALADSPSGELDLAHFDDARE